MKKFGHLPAWVEVDHYLDGTVIPCGITTPETAWNEKVQEEIDTKKKEGWNRTKVFLGSG